MLGSTDNFDKTKFAYIRSFSLSIICMVSQIVLFFGNVGVQTPSLSIAYTAAKVVAIVSGAYFFLLLGHFQLIVLRRIQWGRKLSDISTNHLCFMIYSCILQGGTAITCGVLVSHGVDGYKISAQELIVHQIAMIIYALLNLPVRIARLQWGRAKSNAARAKNSVLQTLNAPLRVLLLELDSLLDDEAVMAEINAQGAQRLARIAFACDSAVESLRKVAGMTDDVGTWVMGDDGWSGYMMNEISEK